MRPLRVTYGLIGCFFVMERLLRQGESAKSFQEGQADRGSTRAVGAAFGLALLVLLMAPLLNGRGIGRLRGERVGWGGVAAMVAGLVLRMWANRVLGSFYTRTLRTEAEQRLIEEGPYRLVRHPGYLGSLLLWLGAGVATGNWMAVMARAFQCTRNTSFTYQQKMHWAFYRATKQVFWVYWKALGYGCFLSCTGRLLVSDSGGGGDAC
jgi:protein-S-isoprenylcysteine O-methyltransferase Ste14